MILSDSKIKKNIWSGNIVIQPFDEDHLGSNSYDVRLSKYLKTYREEPLDLLSENETKTLEIPNSGLLLQPDTLYLGSTMEYTETHHHVPFLEGRSSIGRLGIDIHATAGVGDVGFKGHWTLEISVTQPVIIYPNIRIGQLIYMSVEGKVNIPYDIKVSAKYSNSIKDYLPIESKYHTDA